MQTKLLTHTFNFIKSTMMIWGLYALTAAAVHALQDTQTENSNTATTEQSISQDSMKSYYSNLRACKPSVNNYVMPGLGTAVVSTIQGFQNDKCIVMTSYKLGGGANIGETKMEMNCQFPQEDLAYFTDAEATSTSHHYDSSHPKPIQKALRTDCQVTANGEKLNSM